MPTLFYITIRSITIKQFLDIDEQHIKLQRENYTYEAGFQEFKSLLMYKGDKYCWLLILQKNNIVRPIDLTLWKDSLDDIQNTLDEITAPINLPFDYTEDVKLANELFDKADRVPETEVFTGENSEKSFHLLIGGLSMWSSFFLYSTLFLFKDYSFGELSGGLILFLSFTPLTLFYIFTRLKKGQQYKKDECFTLSSKGFEGKISFDWDQFLYIQRKQEYRSATLHIQAKQASTSLSLPSLESSMIEDELPEQFSYFAKKLIEYKH